MDIRISLYASTYPDPVFRFDFAERKRITSVLIGQSGWTINNLLPIWSRGDDDMVALYRRYREAYREINLLMLENYNDSAKDFSATVKAFLAT